MQGEPEICRDFRKGVCFRVNCRYAHINADGTPGTPNDQPVCRDFENGRCFRSNCRFFHRSAPELLAANLANSKRQGEPSPHDIIDRFGPLGLTHPDYASYAFGGADLSPSDARALLARELAKRELAISNRMLELSLAERALLELSIRERRQALGRLEPPPYQSLGRRDSVPLPGYNDVNPPLGVRPSPTLQSSLNRTQSVPVQGFGGVVPLRHAEVLPPPRLDRRSSVPSHGLDLEGGEHEGGGSGWQTPGREYPPGMGNPPLNRSTSETVQNLQEMRRAADSLLLDLERARRKESLSMPGSPELVPGDRAPSLELDPRLMNRGLTRAPVLHPEGGQQEGGGQGLDRFGSMRSTPKSSEMQGLQRYASEPVGKQRGGNPGPKVGGGEEPLDGRVSPQGEGIRKSPQPSDEELRRFRGGQMMEGMGVSDSSMHGSEREARSDGELVSPDGGDDHHRSKSLQASPETRALGSGPTQGFGRGVNGLDHRRAGNVPSSQEGLVRSMGSMNQGQQEGLARSLGTIAPKQGQPEGLVRSMGSINPGQGLSRTSSGPFGGDYSNDSLRAPLSRRPSGTPSGFVGQEGRSPRAGGSSSASGLFASYREQAPWLSPEEQKDIFRHEQSKIYDQDRAMLERALRSQQLGRQMSGGFDGGSLEVQGHEGRGALDQDLGRGFGHFRPEQGLGGPFSQHPLEYARFPAVQQQQQPQRQPAPQAQSQQPPVTRPQYAEVAPGPPTPPASETVSPATDSFQEYSPFGNQASLFKENSGKSIW